MNAYNHHPHLSINMNGETCFCFFSEKSVKNHFHLCENAHFGNPHLSPLILILLYAYSYTVPVWTPINGLNRARGCCHPFPLFLFILGSIHVNHQHQPCASKVSWKFLTGPRLYGLCQARPSLRASWWMMENGWWCLVVHL